MMIYPNVYTNSHYMNLSKRCRIYILERFIQWCIITGLWMWYIAKIIIVCVWCIYNCVNTWQVSLDPKVSNTLSGHGIFNKLKYVVSPSSIECTMMQCAPQNLQVAIILLFMLRSTWISRFAFCLGVKYVQFDAECVYTL